MSRNTPPKTKIVGVQPPMLFRNGVSNGIHKPASYDLTKLSQDAVTPAMIEAAGRDPAEINWLVRLAKIDTLLADQCIKSTNGTRQRNSKELHLQNLVRSVLGGKWAVNGETIVFDWHGRMMQGIHRCRTVVRTGITIESLVVWGVNPDVYDSYDNVAKRSGADTLRSAGVLNSTLVSAMCGFLIRYDIDPTMSTALVVDGQTVLATYNENPHIEESVPFGRRVKTLQSGLTPSVFGAAHYILSQIDASDADHFCESVINGANLDERSPIKMLRERAMRGWRPTAKEQFAYIIKAWNAHRQGKLVKCLKWNQEEGFPVVSR